MSCIPPRQHHIAVGFGKSLPMHGDLLSPGKMAAHGWRQGKDEMGSARLPCPLALDAVAGHRTMFVDSKAEKR